MSRSPHLRVASAVAVLAWTWGLPAPVWATDCPSGEARFDGVAQSALSAGQCNLPLRSSIDRMNGERLVLEPERSTLPADGQSLVRIKVQVLDREGKPVSRDLRLTVEASRGRIVTPEVENTAQQAGFVTDLGDREPGTQFIARGGTAQLLLAAPAEPGEARLRVRAGALSVETTIDFLPELRPLLAVGLLDGIVRFSKLDADAAAPARFNDGLEDELSQIGVSRSGDGTLQAVGRGAVFAKGAVRGDMLLTMAYDSDRDRTRYFRDIQPEHFYPIYGDASLRGFDAQSTRRGYLRLDKGRSYFLFGDFTTGDQGNEALSLGAYQRTLTGGRQHFETRRFKADLFAARDSLRRVIDEQPGRGISGPYQVSNGNGVDNSEQVEIVVRDRNQPAVILDVQSLTRFTDYEFEPFSGRLLFRRPIPTVDSNLNPVSIRVTYEVDGGGPAFWVGGASAQWRVASFLELGASAARDEDPLTPYELWSGNATLRFGEHTTWVFEGALSERDSTLAQLSAEGDGYRSEFRHAGERLEARVFWGSTNAEFDNPTAQLSRGRQELGAKATWRFSAMTDLTLEALQTEDALIGADRSGASLLLGRDFAGERFRVDVGLRYGRDEVNPAAGAGARPNYSSIYNLTPPGSFNSGAFSNGAFANGALTSNEFTTARARLTARFNERSSGYVEGEVGVGDSARSDDPWAYAFGLDYLVFEQTRLYARHEQATSLSGLYGLGTGDEHQATLFGVDTTYMEDGQLFSEYRLRDAISGRDAEAALGLRNVWRVAKGLALSTSLERLEALDGSAREATAATFGVEFTRSERHKASARFEWRDDVAAVSYLSTLAWTAKLDRDWSVLARNLFSQSDNEDPSLGKLTQNRALVGLAYRDTDTNRWSSLMRYEFKTERDTAVLGPVDRDAHVVSLHANYKPRRALTLSAQVAGKWVDETFADSLGSVRDKFAAQLVSGRVLYDITERWDIGANASVLRSDAGATQYGLGLEAGVVLVDNLWLSLGYNVVGFADDDLVDADYTRQGLYLRLRYKFDEKLFGRANPRVNRTLPPEPSQPGTTP